MPVCTVLHSGPQEFSYRKHNVHQ